MEVEAFESHPLWHVARQVRSLLDESDATVNPSQIPAMDRLRFLLSELMGYRKADPEYFVIGQLDSAHTQWVQARTYLSNARTSPGQEESAVNAAEGWLMQAGSWYRPTESGPLAPQARAAYEELIHSYRTALDNLRNQRQADVEAAESAQQELREQLRGLQYQVDKAQEALIMMSEKVSADEATLQGALTQHSELFRAAQAERATDFTEWLRAEEKQFVDLAEPHVKNIATMESVGERVLQKIQTLGDQVEIAAGLSTGDVLTREFAASAKTELKTATNAFWGGIVLSILGVVWLAVVAIATFGGSQPFNPSWFVAKLSLALALGGVATILFRRAQHAQTTARTYKRTELELRAIGPYLSDIQNREVAEDAKVNFLRRTFGRDDSSAPGKTAEVGESDVVKKALELVTTAVEKLPK